MSEAASSHTGVELTSVLLLDDNGKPFLIWRPILWDGGKGNKSC